MSAVCYAGKTVMGRSLIIARISVAGSRIRIVLSATINPKFLSQRARKSSLAIRSSQMGSSQALCPLRWPAHPDLPLRSPVPSPLRLQDDGIPPNSPLTPLSRDQTSSEGSDSEDVEYYVETDETGAERHFTYDNNGNEIPYP
jgi:hypothetical protein